MLRVVRLGIVLEAGGCARLDGLVQVEQSPTALIRVTGAYSGHRLEKGGSAVAGGVQGLRYLSSAAVK